ncbi:TlpA family protein disulfide reductase [Abyssibius alkaniclasticus]|uniref:TlpA family protein disulfide reductase n=1 Tax=Abyssibius alkaniclasticus TaxID=2881234 RepID=UPI0040595E15|tara:strand:- start:60 stop:632 length:573 start_codon:yes stop_codon:yes gene_type:complete
MTLRKLSFALLYAATALVANPSIAGTLSAEERAAIESMRSDSLRRLVIHSEPRDVVDVGYVSKAGEAQTIPANGRLNVVNFWATWCAPCREEMPALDRLRAELGDEAGVIAIATGRNRVEDIERFNEDVGVTMPINLDPRGDLAAAHGAMGLPTTIVFDGEGREIARLTGAAEWDKAGPIIRALVEALAD